MSASAGSSGHNTENAYRRLVPILLQNSANESASRAGSMILTLSALFYPVRSDFAV
jgi:hypothetical protein